MKTAVFVLTNRCNLNCDFCLSSAEDKVMSHDEVIKAISELPEKVEKIVFTGGEVFLRNDLIELIDFCKKQNYKVGISTNGTYLKWLTEEQIEKIDEFNLPLDGILKSHDQFRGTGHFNTILGLIKKLWPHVNINTVVTSKNYSDILPLSRLIKMLNIKKWKINKFKQIGQGTGKSQLEISQEEFDELKSKIDHAIFIDDIEDQSKYSMFGGKK